MGCRNLRSRVPKLELPFGNHCLQIRADFREGDEDSNLSIFRVQRFTEWPKPPHFIAFAVDILTKPLIH